MKAIIRKTFLLIYFLIAICFSLKAQEAKIYFNKIADITNSHKLVTEVYKSLDSLKNTRMPSRSSIKLYFNRNIDCGLKQQRVLITLNEIDYQIDLLTRNDSIYYNITATGEGFKGYDIYKLSKVTEDTLLITDFLIKRNNIYHSLKNVKDLKTEMSLNKVYAFYCGDAMQKTAEGKYIEDLVSKKNINELRDMLKSINCETQAYGVAGFEMLIKQKFKISPIDLEIIKHIKKRNSELITCSGCFSGLINKVYSVE